MNANPLEDRGWTHTRAGRWIDPVSGRSYTAQEAWEIINTRELPPRKTGRPVTSGVCVAYTQRHE